ncbi:hypothetical protein MFLO_03610 [Listeria floridensis FSL S10-1187]|uniref:DUF4352 domain-containing protein n=1 Tax=Listeria floridensis FSL S10-1187 TaxID=1265817 RepID=A0ABP3B2R1_9LIST|nr:DUF4352 domain-containing protein [Listeria floridensis]EUJ33386.1 hypothetical protein MFLO_03610 [Listeria floridensis FSL S10-1187]
MVMWIFGGIIAFILFIVGLVILFFPTRRKVGAILVGVGMVLMIISITAIFLQFKQLNDVNNSVLNYSSNKAAKQSDTANDSKTYKLNQKMSEVGIEAEITAVKVEKKAVYSTIDQKEMPGSISITLSIKNTGTEELTTYPNQGTLIAIKQEVTGGDALLSKFDDSKVAPGKTIQGTVVFPLEKLDKVNDIQSISFSWLSYAGSSTEPSTVDSGEIKLK